jgi:hypothetical protein
MLISLSFVLGTQSLSDISPVSISGTVIRVFCGLR